MTKKKKPTTLKNLPVSPVTPENNPVKPKFHVQSKNIQPASPEVTPVVVKKKHPHIKIALIITGLLSLIIFLSGIAVLTVVYWYVSAFAQAAGTTPKALITNVRQGMHISPVQTDSRINFLVLGIDEIVGQKEGSKLTDTIILGSYNLNNHNINLLSIPRDLWIEPLKTKINALYYYGEISQTTTGKALMSSVVSEITKLPIHYTVVVNLQTLEKIINTVGGVDIDVPETFSDDKFPKSDVDVTKEKDPAKLYETITFEKGIRHMDGHTALKYIRSRHSQDENEGNDQARNLRQQQLIQAVIVKIKTKEIITKPEILGELYRLFKTEIAPPELSDPQLIALLKANGKAYPVIKTINLPVGDKTNKGVIYHPTQLKYGQWVYQPLDPTWNELQLYLKEKL
jgi:LCP family protein required for cell wall assembly